MLGKCSKEKHCPRLVDVHTNARWPQAEVKFPKHKEANNTGREETYATDENWSRQDEHTSHQATPDLSQPLRPWPEPGLSGRVEAACSESLSGKVPEGWGQHGTVTTGSSSWEEERSQQSHHNSRESGKPVWGRGLPESPGGVT